MADKARYENRYAKIQPAVAIKPKPLKGQSPSKVSFNPKYDPLKGVSTIISDDNSNINTSRQWVLPPRPRPGRKPNVKESGTSASCSAPFSTSRITGSTSSVSGPASSSASVSGQATSGTSESTPSESTPSGASPAGASPPGAPSGSAQLNLTSAPPKTTGSSATSKITRAQTSPAPASTSFIPLNRYETDPKKHATPVHHDITLLQKTLLARLKEQELVQNYIEVLTNHIHELKLAQSGVITVNALDQKPLPKLQAQTSPDHLDHIHNVRDLDKFLAHLTTQSKVIHSVTKKYVSEAGDANLSQQIKYQLKLKKDYDTAHRPSARPVSISPNPASSDSDVPELPVAKPFTPSLLRPMNLNTLETEDDVIDVDIIKDTDMFERVKDDDNFSVQSRPRRRGCGFCSGEGPCLCFDVDTLFGERSM